MHLPATAKSAQLSSETSAAQLHFLVDRLLAALLPERLTLLLVEDAHWLDEASSELLRTVLRKVDERGWAALVTRRIGGCGLSDLPGTPTRIALEPLDADAARRLVLSSGAAALARVPQEAAKGQNFTPAHLGLFRRNTGPPPVLGASVRSHGAKAALSIDRRRTTAGVWLYTDTAWAERVEHFRDRGVRSS